MEVNIGVELNNLFKSLKDQFPELGKFYKHKCTINKIRYQPSIGGKYTFQFIPTGIGTCILIKCACGKEIDLSHVERW